MLMNNEKVIPFMNVTLRHSFYNNNLIEDIEVVPTPSSAVLMQKIGMIFKPEGTSFNLGASARTLTAVKDIPDKVMLVFLLKNNNPYFQHITELPMYRSGKELFYFDNKNESNTKVTLLHHAEFVSGIDSLKNVDSLEVNLVLQNSPTSVSVENSNGAIVRNYEPDEVDEINQISFDLAEETPDRFAFIINGEKQKPFYCFPSAVEHHFGVIHLYFDLEMLERQSENVAEKYNYEIRFNSRKVYFRYYFISAQIDEDFSFSIRRSDQEEPLSFSKPKLVSLSNGSEALVIISEFPFSFKQSYPYQFSMNFKLNKDTRKEQTIALPFPDWRQIKMERIREEDVIVADAYLYI